MPILTPGQSFDHLLTVVSGYHGMHDLQYHAGVAANETWNRGSLVSLNSAGLLKRGCGDDEMPLWAINSTADFDVSADSGNISGGVVATYPATGGYELKTTEFETDQTYVPNDKLTAGLGVEEGNVTRSPTMYNDRVIVGVVSKGTGTGNYNQRILNFWSLFIPVLRASSLNPSPASSSSSSS
jgi:hypothetical protein